MSTIDVEALLQPVSPDSPAGEDLEYDPQFGELERAAQGKPEQQFGDTIVPAEEPDWREVRALALGVAERTRDLRVLPHLTSALVRLDGWRGFADAAALLQGYVERLWDELHPRLDPDDDNDPTFRVNSVAALADKATVLRYLREAPLVSSRALGQWGFGDVEVARGEASLPADHRGPAPEMATIEGAFLDADPDELEATVAAIGSALEAVRAADAALSGHVGPGAAPDLSDLVGLLTQARATAASYVVGGGGEIGDDVPADATGGGTGPPPVAALGAASAVAPGELRSREDVIRTLDRCCEFFERTEPSSPVPILLRRARRLVNKDFLAILQDLAPDGVSQVQFFRGEEDE